MAISLKDYQAKKGSVSVGAGSISLKKLYPDKAKKLELDASTVEKAKFQADIGNEVEKQKAPSMVTLPTVTTEGFTPLKLDMPDPTSRLDWLGGALEKLVNASSESYSSLLTAGKNLVSSDKTTVAGKIGEGVNVVSKTIGAVFSPISAAFSAAEEIPLLGLGAKAVNFGLGKIGEGGAYLAGSAIDKMPFVSEEAKKELKAPFEELGALAAQVAVGGAIARGKAGYKALEGKLDAAIAEKAAYVQSQGLQMTPAIAKKIAESSIREIKNEIRWEKEAVAKQKVEPQVVAKKPATPYVREVTDGLLGELKRTPKETVSKAFIADQIGREALPKRVSKTYEEVLGEFGDKIPKAEFEARVREAMGMVEKPAEVVPIAKEAVVEAQKSPEAIVEPTGEMKPSQVIVEPFKAEERATPAEGVETKVSKPAWDLMESAIEKAVIKEKLELPETETLKMEPAREATRKLIKEDPNRAFDVAMGRADAPIETRASMIWKAMSEYAMETKNPEMVMELANSSVPRTGTEAGRFSKAFDFSEVATSPVETIIKVQKTREGAAKKRYGDKPDAKAKEIERKSMEKEIPKMKPKDWSSFIDSIVCK